MWNEFKKFIARGSVIDLAVGIVIGTAFTAIVNSFVKDILMPPIGVLLGKVDFSNLFITLSGQKAGTLADAQALGSVTWNYGQFINTIVNFLIIAFVVFILIRGINKLQKPAPASAPAPSTKDCPYCYSKIDLKATRCPHCTSNLES
jgi:large conductance mechanosensitive channel